jgi:exopolyphosphatase/guanosine-5'-triphosphate,3'-diphosphate pyrophosphatase
MLQKRMTMQRIAAIDTGSNAIRLVVADLDENGQVQPIDNLRIPVRLGRDAFKEGILQEGTMQQAIEAFRQFRKVIDDFGVARVKAVATSAMREAQNGPILIDRIARASGIELEIINGEEEARLVHQAVTAVMDLADKNALLIDIGGGSIEITLTRGNNILSVNSYPMGTVRLLQKLEWNQTSRNPIEFGQLVQEYVDAAAKRIRQEVGEERIDLCIGTGGNVEEIGKLRQRLFKKENDRAVRVDEMEKMIDRLSRMTFQERMRKFNLRPDRADVILPALTVLRLVAQISDVEEIQIPNVGLKNGLLIDMALNASQENPLPDHEQVVDSAIRLGKKYAFDVDHAAVVMRLSLRLFDQLQKYHRLDQEERMELEIAAILHDVGHFISTIDHDQHGYYILQANHLVGLTERQQMIIASIVRYHRRGTPFYDGLIETKLVQKDRRIVMILTSILRLADEMDASHTQRVMDVLVSTTPDKTVLRLVGKGDLTLEKWAVSKRSSLFTDLFGNSLEILA